MMKKALTSLLALLVMSGCGGTITQPGNPVVLSPGAITIQNIIPYEVDTLISDHTKDEREIGQQLSAAIKGAAGDDGLELRGVDVADASEPGNVLKLEITHAVSNGHPGLGHRKGTFIRGELFENGKLLASFSGARTSDRGFLGKYRSSCSVLG